MLRKIYFISYGILCLVFMLSTISYANIDDWTFEQFREWKLSLPDNHMIERIADLDRDSVEERYVLENGILRIFEMDNLIYQSPDRWWIDNFVLADSTHDGLININLSLWKSGSFGRSKPFWVEEDDNRIRNHFRVMKLQDNRARAVWMSSNLSHPNLEFTFADIDNDSKQELIVIESNYDDYPIDYGEYVAVWKWSSWGFFNERRSEKGKYSNLRLIMTDYEHSLSFDSY